MRLVVEAVEVERPSPKRNAVSDFPHLIAFAWNREDVEALLQREVQYWSGDGGHLGVLIEASVGCSNHAALADGQSSANSGTVAGFSERSGKPFEPVTGVDGQPRGRAEGVFREPGQDGRPELFRFRE